MESTRQRPKVSVIIPCYNRENYINQTIACVLNQTYPNIEVFAVDDGSTDNTPQILKSYKNDLIILEHPGRINKGQSAAINMVLSKTNGKYIAILDSDDLWAADKTEKQVDYLESYPYIGLVYSNGFAIDENGNKQYKIFEKGHKEVNDPYRMLLECHFNIPSNALVRSEVFKKVGGFDENMRSAQDHDMGIRIAEVTTVAYLDEPLWYYRRHQASQSGHHAMRRWKIGYRILNKARKRYPYPFKVILKRLAVLNFHMGQCYFEEKNVLKAFLFFIAAGICDPLRSLRVLLGKEKIGSPH